MVISYSSTRKQIQLPTEAGWNKVERKENGNGVEGIRGSEQTFREHISVIMSFSGILTF